jgi:hypothetical protein
MTVGAMAQPVAPEETDSVGLFRDNPAPPNFPLSLFGDDRLAAPSTQRPRMTMQLPLGREPALDGGRGRSFSLSLEAWQLNTASLAHIQCNNHSLSLDSYVAEDCRFVDQPLPENSVNLVQVRGKWTASPGVSLGVGAFHSDHGDPNLHGVEIPIFPSAISSALQPNLLAALSGRRIETSDGLDFNLSFGIDTDHLGDFLVGLQVARYRQRMSLVEMGLSNPGAIQTLSEYASSAQLELGWRRGSFSGDLTGSYRDAPLWLNGQSTPAVFNSFDLEFSWQPNNSSLSIGISNVLDASPRPDEPEAALEDPLEQVYGRIPYVRYKHDL